MELKGIRGVVVLAAAGLEALCMAGRGLLSTVCIDCFRNCWEVGCMLLTVLRVALCSLTSECHMNCQNEMP